MSMSDGTNDNNNHYIHDKYRTSQSNDILPVAITCSYFADNKNPMLSKFRFSSVKELEITELYHPKPQQDAICNFVQSSAQLESLTMSAFGNSSQQQRIVTAALQNPSITKITLSDLNDSPEYDGVVLTTKQMCDWLNYNNCLVDLELLFRKPVKIQSSSLCSLQDLAKSVTCHSTLETFQMSRVKFTNQNENEIDNHNFNYINYETDFLMAVLQRLRRQQKTPTSRLKKVALNSMNSYTSIDCNPKSGNVESLLLSGNNDACYAQVDQILKEIADYHCHSCTHVSLILRNREWTAPSLVDLLVSPTSSIQSLTLDCWTCTPKTMAVLYAMAQCTTLRTIEFIDCKFDLSSSVFFSSSLDEESLSLLKNVKNVTKNHHSSMLQKLVLTNVLFRSTYEMSWLASIFSTAKIAILHVSYNRSLLHIPPIYRQNNDQSALIPILLDNLLWVEQVKLRHDVANHHRGLVVVEDMVSEMTQHQYGHLQELDILIIGMAPSDDESGMLTVHDDRLLPNSLYSLCVRNAANQFQTTLPLSVWSQGLYAYSKYRTNGRDIVFRQLLQSEEVMGPDHVIVVPTR